ncbi:recombinase family protein [Bacillus salacetis]|uniref:recombinase family protein n=1 Tax=Bacillus salacetis TaxID=2315464 RepID=UPI003BA0FA28
MSKNNSEQQVSNLDTILTLQQEFKEIIQSIIIGPINLGECLPSIKKLPSEPIRMAIGYIRYSDKKQDENNSIAIQKREIENKARLEGYQIILWCMDKAVSATHKSALKRPWMQVLFESALLKDFNGAIFFCEESRVTRQVHDFVRGVHDPLKEKKVTIKFFSTTEPNEWDPNKPHIQAKLLIYRNESEYKKNRTIWYHQNCLYPSEGQKPKRPGAPLPYGYIKGEEGEVSIDNSEHKADIVYLIYYLSSYGYSNKYIATYLNECGIPSPKEKKWSASMIDKILHNLFYQGHLTWGVRDSNTNSARKKIGQFELFEHQHDAIIPQHLADGVKQMKRFKSQFGRNLNTPFALKDLIVCKDCGERLISKNFTPGTSKKDKDKNNDKKKQNQKLVYRCVNCIKYVEVEQVHAIFLKKFFDHLSKNNSMMKREIRNSLKRWDKTLKQKQMKISQSLQHVKEQERFVAHESEMVGSELAISIADTLSFLSEKNNEIAELIEQIEKMLEADELELYLTKFFDHQSNMLNDLELRSLSLFFIEKIELDLSTNNAAIHYRITPFIDLENWIGQVTAD